MLKAQIFVFKNQNDKNVQITGTCQGAGLFLSYDTQKEIHGIDAFFYYVPRGASGRSDPNERRIGRT